MLFPLIVKNICGTAAWAVKELALVWCYSLLKHKHRSVTHWGHLWLLVSPAGCHGAHYGPTGVHVQVPPGQNHLSPAAWQSHKLGGVGLEGAAHRLAKIHAEREGWQSERDVNNCRCIRASVSFLTWTWCRRDPAGWSWQETPGSAGCRTPRELRHTGPLRAEGPAWPPPPPLAAAEPSSIEAPTLPAGRRRWPGEGRPRSAPAGQQKESKTTGNSPNLQLWGSCWRMQEKCDSTHLHQVLVGMLVAGQSSFTDQLSIEQLCDQDVGLPLHVSIWKTGFWLWKQMHCCVSNECCFFKCPLLVWFCAWSESLQFGRKEWC